MMKRDSFGLRAWQGSVVEMLEPHQHSEIELNFVTRGSITYQFSHQDIRVLEGQWLVFWAAWPHHLTQYAPGTHAVWLTLPLATFLRMNLPEHLGERILHNQPVLEQGRHDEPIFRQWADDGEHLSGEHQRILELELEARLRRLALQQPARKGRIPKRAALGKAERMAHFVGTHHLEPIGLPEIAASVELNPNYAAGLFRRTFGMTILEYLTQHRIAHAQRLLATTDSIVLEIVFASGFGSSSQFYAAFERATGSTPLAYRRKVRNAFRRT